jgi:NADPH-dependent 2,4-dienoyl-CoA reductase/sulfur reductase-like enzyme
MAHIVIIGNGIAGITCARHVRKKSTDKITIISSETKHFYARTALMYIYMGHMKFEHTKPYEDFFWQKNNLDLLQEIVKTIDTGKKQLLLDNGSTINYDKLVIASGSKSNIADIPGKDIIGVQGLYNYPDLQRMEQLTKNIKSAVIAGGGLIGIEMAEMLVSRNIHVTMIIRDMVYWGGVLPEEEGRLVSRHIEEHKIKLVLKDEVAEIKGNETGNVIAVKTKNGDVINCDFVGLTIGVSANISFLKDTGITTDKGVLVNEYLETNIPDVYAIGDCVQYITPPAGRKPIEQVWYTGRMHGETLAETLIGNRTAYKPGPWFNSAKFLDIEYQTYGDVPPKIIDSEKDFYWEHEKGKIALRIRYNEKDGSLRGINTFGMRLRHGVIEAWLLDKKSVEYMLAHLADANFDPEFFKTYEHQIVEKYNTENNKNLKVQKRSWKRLLQILKG